jgi:hypothetical protein
LLIEASAIVSSLPLVLSVVRVQRLTGALGRSLDGRRAAGRVDEPRARQIARVVAMAAGHTPTANTCLHRSLTLWWVLGRRGLDSHFKMGARLHEGTLDAHAWVEHSGVVINDDPEIISEYTPLATSAGTLSQASASEPARTAAFAKPRMHREASASPPEPWRRRERGTREQ